MGRCRSRYVGLQDSALQGMPPGPLMQLATILKAGTSTMGSYMKYNTDNIKGENSTLTQQTKVLDSRTQD